MPDFFSQAQLQFCGSTELFNFRLPYYHKIFILQLVEKIFEKILGLFNSY